MAYYSEGGYYGAEEARRPYVASPGGYYGEGGERYAVRKEYEEVDEVGRAGRGPHHHHHDHHVHGHLGHGGGSHRVYVGDEGYHERLGERHHVHGHGPYAGGRHYDAVESKYEASTGEYYA
ncbi:hypothetical protein ACP70R_036227 [Stipagrostis hirtigluma subsp. patula]